LHQLSTSFVLGYHGCDQGIGERLLKGAAFTPSNNDYDWLGPGIYFWEANPQRGLDFARELSRRFGTRIRRPFVVGAVVSLGLCLDLTTAAGIAQVTEVYEALLHMTATGKFAVPRNPLNLLLRPLDNFVIQMLHKIRSDRGETPIDTVKGVFIEGKPIYAGSGFFEKTHIQIAVCNPDCIKGVFRVPDAQLQSI
jgi:hypothetical protein